MPPSRLAAPAFQHTAKMQPMQRLPLFLRLYPLALIVGSIVAFGFCQWFHVADLTYSEIFSRLSLMQLVTACPQLLAAAFLLYYALTFQRESSAFAHRMLVESFPHQAVLSLLVLSLVRSSLETATSLCCAFPSHCPMDATSCRLAAILPCPPDELKSEHYRLYPRLAQFLASWLLVAALASVGAAHTVKDMHLRYRQADFITFSRRQEAQPATASVKL